MVEVNICRRYNWTLVSLHTRQEQDFLGQLLVNKLKSVNEETYIGKQYQVFFHFTMLKFLHTSVA